MIGNETLETVRYIHLGQTLTVNLTHDKEIKRRMGLDCSASESYFTNIQLRSLASHKRLKENWEVYWRNGGVNAWTNMEI